MTPAGLTQTQVETHEEAVRSYVVDRTYLLPFHEEQADKFEFARLQSITSLAETVAEAKGYPPFINDANYQTATNRNAHHAYAGRQQLMAYGMRSAANTATIPYTVLASTMSDGRYSG